MLLANSEILDELDETFGYKKVKVKNIIENAGHHGLVYTYGAILSVRDNDYLMMIKKDGEKKMELLPLTAAAFYDLVSFEAVVSPCDNLIFKVEPTEDDIFSSNIFEYADKKYRLGHDAVQQILLGGVSAEEFFYDAFDYDEIKAANPKLLMNAPKKFVFKEGSFEDNARKALDQIIEEKSKEEKKHSPFFVKMKKTLNEMDEER